MIPPEPLCLQALLFGIWPPCALLTCALCVHRRSLQDEEDSPNVLLSMRRVGAQEPELKCIAINKVPASPLLEHPAVVDRASNLADAAPLQKAWRRVARDPLVVAYVTSSNCPGICCGGDAASTLCGLLDVMGAWQVRPNEMAVGASDQHVRVYDRRMMAPGELVSLDAACHHGRHLASPWPQACWSSSPL